MANPAKPIPQGFHTLTPHLIVRDAGKALEFYKKAFGAEEIARMPGPGGKIMHAEMKIGDSMVMLAEEFPDMHCLSPQALKGSPVSLHLYVRDVDASFKRAVDAGAKATMPVADMFWGDRFGKLTDPYGHEWSLATHIRDMTPEECAKAGAEAMKGCGQK